MGTTADAIRSQRGVSLGYVLCIEGYKYLLTTGTPSDATTAWSGTLWSDALPGLQIAGTFEQSLEPWQDELSVPFITFAVQPESTDQFGRDMFKEKPAIRSELTAGFDTGDSSGGSFNITVQNATQFSGQDYVFIGTEAFSVSSASGTTISVAANGEGYFAPFSTNVGSTSRFPNTHDIRPTSVSGTNQVAKPVYVGDSPPTWIGKKVGLWVHRIVDGVWDAKSEAQLEFAGTITDVTEDGGGNTIVHCADIRKSLKDCIFMQDQWTAKLEPGFNFEEGDTFYVSYVGWDGGAGSLDYVDANNPLTCISSGGTPAGSYEFKAGRYTADEFAVYLSSWLNTDSAIGRGGAATVQLNWSTGRIETTQGPRYRILGEQSSTKPCGLAFAASRPELLEFLGFEVGETTEEGRVTTKKDGWNGDTRRPSITSDEAPWEIPPLSLAAGELTTLDLVDSDGTYLEHTTWLPEEAQKFVGSGESWSFFLYGDSTLFLAKKVSDTQLQARRSFQFLGGTNIIRQLEAGSRYGEGGSVTIKQVAVISGTLTDVFATLFASIDGNGANHATYDTISHGGAAIPWELLGSNFISSLNALEQSTDEDSVTLIAEKAIPLWDLIKSELVLRMSGVIWKDEGLQMAQFTVPNASTADHTLTEANKSDSRRTRPNVTRQYQAHTVKIEHGRDPATDKYSKTLVARDIGAYQSQGGAGNTKTIKARNLYDTATGTGSNVETFGELLVARFLPVLSKPLKTYERSIPHTHFHMCPGDTVAITDDWIRDPTSGARGIESRAASVLSVSYSYGVDSTQDYFGTVRLMYTEEDRTFPLAPSMEHASVSGTTAGSGTTFTNGWANTEKELLVYQRKFSLSPYGTDSSHFSVGDVIRITQLDEGSSNFTDTIANIYSDTIGGVDYDVIELTTGTGFGASIAGGEYHVVNFGEYGSVGSAQKLHAFQADNSDGAIVDTIDPNLYGEKLSLPGESPDLTLLPYKHKSAMYGDGVAMSASTLRGVCRMANNLANRKTASNTGFFQPSYTGYAVSSSYETIYTFPFLIGAGAWPGTKSRTLYIAPVFSTVGVGTANVRITSSENPPSNDTYTDAQFRGAFQQITFSTTSSTIQYPSAAELKVCRSISYPEITWITIEADGDTSIRGLSECWLGPLT